MSFTFMRVFYAYPPVYNNNNKEASNNRPIVINSF